MQLDRFREMLDQAFVQGYQARGVVRLAPEAEQASAYHWELCKFRSAVEEILTSLE